MADSDEETRSIGRCHVLLTHLIFWTGSTEWWVDYRDGLYRAANGDRRLTPCGWPEVQDLWRRETEEKKQ